MNFLIQKIKEWSILLSALLLLAIGGVALSISGGRQPEPAITTTTNTAPGANNQKPASDVLKSQPAGKAPEQAKGPTPAGTGEPLERTTQAQAPSAAPKSVAPSHNHTAASTPLPPGPNTAINIGNQKQTASVQTPVAGDLESGRQVYRKCQACHSLEPGKNSLGPSLSDILGKKSAAVPNYNYSPALKSANLTWDVATLEAYLTNPQKLVPGNKMPFPGLKNQKERTDVIAYLAGSGGAAPKVAQIAPTAREPSTPPAAAAPGNTGDRNSVSYIPDVRYTLRSGISEGRMVYIGVGGAIDGLANPVLSAAEGQVVQITLLNGEGAEHDIVFDGQDAKSPRITGSGTSTSLVFRAQKAGDYIYFCSVPGHQLAGMQGQFLVTPRPPAQQVVQADISQLSTAVPAPIGNREPQTIRVDLVAVELEGRLAEGTTFGYWTFNGRVPGPMLRVRVGDTLDVHVKNADDSTMVHSVDFHAATGPGGGAASTQVDPGAEKSFKFKALTPGLYVYHCATPMVAHHIANGMYGLILVEPEGGLPSVDREFYVMQGEVYTEAAFGKHGSQEFSVEKLLNERPEYFVFNGSVGALSKLHPLQAKVGETVRIFFGVGGPNFTSSFHVIGEIFDKVYALGGVTSPPLTGIQTVTVPAGGAVIVEFKLDVPGNYVLVDHALSRAERGLVGILHAEGQANPEIFDGKVEPGSGH